VCVGVCEDACVTAVLSVCIFVHVYCLLLVVFQIVPLIMRICCLKLCFPWPCLCCPGNGPELGKVLTLFSHSPVRVALEMVLD